MNTGRKGAHGEVPNTNVERATSQHKAQDGDAFSRCDMPDSLVKTS